MTMLRRAVPVETEVLGEREVRIRMMTGGVKRDGNDIDPMGCVLDNYAANPVQLWQHDPDYPVAINEDLAVDANGITARCVFAPAGLSAKADEICGLVKAGIVRSVSIGFEILESEPLDPKRPRGGLRVTKWELLECSYVSVPADPQALVTAREHRAQGGTEMASEWKCGAARDLPIDDTDAGWDGGEAAKAIFDWAGGDSFDPAKARQAFLAYDAANADLRGSYKLPFARPVNGELKVPAPALRAAASRLPQSDLPQDVQDEAAKVLAAYEAKAGIGAAADGAGDGGRSGRRPLRRGMYGIASLAYALDQLGCCQEAAAVEAAFEGDQSEVPALLMEAIKAGCTALIAMTAEECAEMIAGDDADDIDVVMMSTRPPAERYHRARRLLSRLARAGKTLSAATIDTLQQALDHHDAAMAQHRAAMAEHRRGIACIRDMLDGAGVDTTAGDAPVEGDEARARADFRRRQRDKLALAGGAG